MTDVEVAGDRATAVSTFANEREELAFEREDGEWKVGPEPTSGSPDEVDRATADSWPEKWCDIRLGMTRSQVQAVNGAADGNAHGGAVAGGV